MAAMSAGGIDETRAARHREKMVARKAVQDAEVAEKTVEKGLLMVHTGPGKGKSTAAFGLALRMLGNGGRVGIVQFIKGAWSTGEQTALVQAFGDRVIWKTMGEGFTWDVQDLARDVAAATAAWETALEMMDDPSISLVILDELNIALRYDYLPLEGVVEALRSRRPDLHVVVTGRNAKPALIEAADLVTEMGLEKHHFRAGVKAQAGIEMIAGLSRKIRPTGLPSAPMWPSVSPHTALDITVSVKALMSPANPPINAPRVVILPQKIEATSTGKLALAAMAKVRPTRKATFCFSKIMPRMMAMMPRPRVANFDTRSSMVSLLRPRAMTLA